MTGFLRLSKGKKILLTGIALVLVMLIVEVLVYSFYETREEPQMQVSVIVSSAQADRWENLRLGAEQAADNTQAEVNLITMSGNGGAGEQIAMINREILNGADALIIEAADSRMIEEYFDTVECDIPVVFFYSGPKTTDNVCYVSTDNYGMGYSLAREIMSQEKEWIKAAIILDDMQKECISDRFDGVYDTLSGYADEIVIWEKDEHTSESELTLFLQEKMIEEAVDVAIAMDTPRTEALIDAAQNLNKDIKIYGIGNSDKIVHYLNQGLVKAVAYQNDFSAGYLSMNVILQGKQDKNLEDAVEYKIVNRDRMYTLEYEKLIFPFVK